MNYGFGILKNCAIIALLGLIMACARVLPHRHGVKAGVSPFTLSLTLNAQEYKPGQPVICRVTLENPTNSAQRIYALDHQSVLFAFQPKKQKEAGEMQFMEPVFSGEEKTEGEVSVEPHASLQRQFVLTTLTFYRGEFALQAVYQRAGNSPGRSAPKTYSRPVFFKVEGKHVFAHRSLNGLEIKEDAIKLACSKVKKPIKGSDVILVRDEYGFLKWWVNLRVEGDNHKQIVKSYFVDPYLARVWKEAKPFTPDDKEKETKIPKDSKVLQNFRDRMGMRGEK